MRDIFNQGSVDSRLAPNSVIADVTAPQAAIGTRSKAPRIRSGVSHPFHAGDRQQSTSHTTTIVLRLAKNVETTDDRLDRFSRKCRASAHPLHRMQNNPKARQRILVSKMLLLKVSVNAAVKTIATSK